MTAFEVPPAVVIVTWAEREPLMGGTVTVHAFGAGQLVGATWPLKVATICPLELRKLDPATSMPCPALPLAGEREAITGGPAATGGAVDVVVLDAAVRPWWPDT